MSAKTPIFTRLTILMGFLTCFLMGVTNAFADGINEAVQLAKSALESYDFFELEEADASIQEAVKIVESEGLDAPGVANIYIAQGIISYGRFKDSARVIGEDRAFSAFLKALTINGNATIPSDYRSPEVEEIFAKAKDAIGSGSVALAGPVAKPKVDHNAILSSNRCNAIDVTANVPIHPDIYRVYLHYAVDDERGYRDLEMTPSQDAVDTLVAKIPALETQGDVIHYFITAENRSGETVVNSATAQLPWDISLSGKCTGLSKEEASLEYGDPLFQWSIMIGTGLGIVSGETINCDGSSDCISGVGGKETRVSTGVASLPFHLRTSGVFNLPANLQLGVYLRAQLVNIVSNHFSNVAKIRVKEDPEIYNIMVGITLRYLILHEQPYRLYVGIEAGWGGANASVDLGKNFSNYVDIYLYEGPFHIAPQVGFLWTFHKHVGLAVELTVPIHFPDKPSAHFDLSVGPYFQF